MKGSAPQMNFLTLRVSLIGTNAASRHVRSDDRFGGKWTRYAKRRETGKETLLLQRQLPPQFLNACRNAISIVAATRYARIALNAVSTSH